MRMRLKKHLDDRLLACQKVLALCEPKDFFELDEQARHSYKIDLAKTFGNDNPIVLELGCGKGSYAITCAQNTPNVNYLAVEKLSNVIVVGCEDALQHNLPNLRFVNCRAENLHYFLPKQSIDTVVLNFSCPFPKKTYANRRLTSKNFLELYKLLLKPNGYVQQKTDDRAFFEFSLESYAQNGYETHDVTYDLPADAMGNVVTEYESKFRALGKPIYAVKAKIK